MLQIVYGTGVYMESRGEYYEEDDALLNYRYIPWEHFRRSTSVSCKDGNDTQQMWVHACIVYGWMDGWMDGWMAVCSRRHFVFFFFFFFFFFFHNNYLQV